MKNKKEIDEKITHIIGCLYSKDTDDWKYWKSQIDIILDLCHSSTQSAVRKAEERMIEKARSKSPAFGKPYYAGYHHCIDVLKKLQNHSKRG